MNSIPKVTYQTPEQIADRIKDRKLQATLPPSGAVAIQQVELARGITGLSALVGELKEIYQLREQVRRATPSTRKPLRNRRKKQRKSS